MSGRSPASQSRPGWAVAGRALPLALLALFLPSCDTFQPSYPEFLRQRSHVCPSRYHLSGSGSPLRQTLQAARFATRAAAAEPEEAPQHERERLAELEKLLGVKFKDPSLLNQALVHRSAVTNNLRSNQRLEYLGDSVLGMVVADELFRMLPGANEGKLSEVRKRVINTRALAGAARTMGVGDWIHLAEYEHRRGGRKQDALLADATEAIIAAVFLDSGLEAARGAIAVLLGPALADALSADAVELDPKGKLRERVIKLHLPPPEYHLVGSGPTHNPKFTAHVLLGDQRLGYGVGRTKKAAELAAAAYSLDLLAEMGDDEVDAIRAALAGPEP